MKNYIEKEIKLKVENPNELIDKLRRKGAAYLGGAIERTTRLDTENLDFEKKGKFIRVRSGFSNTMTLKEKIDNDDKLVRRRKETEFEIGNIEKAVYLLQILGLNYSRIMEKYRQSWKYKNVKIELDELPFGVFIEIEGEEKDIQSTCDDLELDSTQKILVTYWHLHEEKSDSKDILFDKNHEMKLI
ncbi:MAG: class IV adenylate cyclase [Nanoarchaeota archaeon]|nr:class IV adenylate cyclase [Nanoarchaeota archaeon]